MPWSSDFFQTCPTRYPGFRECHWVLKPRRFIVSSLETRCSFSCAPYMLTSLFTIPLFTRRAGCFRSFENCCPPPYLRLQVGGISWHGRRSPPTGRLSGAPIYPMDAILFRSAACKASHARGGTGLAFSRTHHSINPRQNATSSAKSSRGCSRLFISLTFSSIRAPVLLLPCAPEAATSGMASVALTRGTALDTARLFLGRAGQSGTNDVRP